MRKIKAIVSAIPPPEDSGAPRNRTEISGLDPIIQFYEFFSILIFSIVQIFGNSMFIYDDQFLVFRKLIHLSLPLLCPISGFDGHSLS